MASEIKVDTISEKTSAGGVTIDGLLIKDGNISGDVALAGTTPTFTIGDAGAEDAALVFDGNAQDFYIGLDDSADDLVIGLGSTVGTTPAISINEDRDVTISDGAIDFDVASHDTSNGLKLGGTLVTATAAELNIMDGVTATAAEINLIDGGTARGTTAIADGDGVLINDAGTMRMTTVQTLKTYIGGSDPSSADGDSLGTASLEWSDLYLADGSIIYMGADQDVTIQHNHNGGLTMKNSYGDTEGFGLHLQTAETTVVATNPIGFITFTAPDEASGTDAVLACAKIQAIAEGTFAADNNATTLEFYTASSEAATVKMKIDSSGDVGIGGTPVADRKLKVFGTSSNRALVVSHDGNEWAFTTYVADNTSDDGQVRLGCTGNDALIYAGGAERFRVASNGDLTATDTSIASNSDSRVKENISDFTYDVAKFKQLQPRTFDWKNPSQHNGVSGNRGFIAQEVQAIDDYWIGELKVSNGDDDYNLLDPVIKNNCVLNKNGNIIVSDISESDWEAGKLNGTYPENSTWTSSKEDKRISLTSKLGKKDAMYISVINQLITRIEALEA